MKKLIKSCVIFSIVILFSRLSPFLEISNVFADSAPINAMGTIVNPFGGSSIPFSLTFTAGGGEVTGTIPAFTSSASMALPAGYQQSGSSSYPDCQIKGTFAGGDGGAFTAFVTCQGKMKTHVTGPSVDFDITGTTNYVAQFDGNFYASGAGNGGVALALTVKNDPYSIMGTDFPASTSPETAYGSDWMLLFSAQEFAAGLAPTEMAATQTPLPVSAATQASVASQAAETAAPKVADLAQEQSVATTKGEQPVQSAQSPLIPIGGGIIGTSTGLLLSLALKNRGQMIVGGVKDGVASPVDGRLVTADEANWQYSQIAEGKVWDGEVGGFRGNDREQQPSILTREYQEEAAYRATHKSPVELWCESEIQRLHQERVQDIRDMMDVDQMMYQRYMQNVRFYDRASYVATKVKTAADFSMEVLAKATGPAGKGIKTFYDVTTSTIDVANTYQQEGLGAAVSQAADSSISILSGVAGEQGEFIKDTYEKAKDLTDLYNDTKDKGLYEGVVNYGKKKVKKVIVDELTPTDENVESYTLRSSMVRTTQETVIDNGVEQGLDLTQNIAEGTAKWGYKKLNNFISGNTAGGK
jgi:hypothetical protein